MKNKIVFSFRISVFGLLLFLTSNILAQQDPMYTHYMYNTLSVNPSYAGSRDALTLTFLNRIQWVDFEGAPVTQTLTLHSPVQSKNIGLGFSFVNDKIGPEKNTMVFFDYAYKIKLNAKSHLSFGLKAGIQSFKIDLSQLDLNEQDDKSFKTNIESKVMPNFGFGLYYQREKFYAGFSAPKLLENKISNNEKIISKLTSKRRHYFAIAGTVFSLSDNVDLKPTALIKFSESAPTEFDFTGTIVFDKKVLAGLMYRTGDALGILAGFQPNEQFFIGYSYDWSMGIKTPTYNLGSHEIVLRYDFFFSEKQRIRSPRYF